MTDTPGEPAAPPAFRLQTFGTLRLVGSADDTILGDHGHQRRRLALLAVLAASGDRGRGRDQLLGLFWPDASQSRAQHSLGQLVYAIRTSLGGDAFSGTNPLRLNAAFITSDIGDFSDALARGEAEAAVELYHGPFLDGFYLTDAPEFEQWMDAERGRVERSYTEALERLAKSAEDANDFAAAARWRRKLSDADPVSGKHASGLIRALMNAGDHASALQYAERYEAIVARELGTSVGPAVAALVAEVRARAKTESVVVRGAAPPPKRQRDSDSSMLVTPDDATLAPSDAPMEASVTHAPAEVRAAVTPAPATDEQRSLADFQEVLAIDLADTYTIERELGGAGMSRVFVAMERRLERRVVVKVLPENLAAGISVDRFRREITLAAKLQHPHIVPVLSSGEVRGTPFFTMPYVEGESLRERLSRSGELPLNTALRILRQVASALAYAHRNGVVHRDIKPENVLLSEEFALVTDFGVAKAIETSAVSSPIQAGAAMTLAGFAIGTPAYMAPEQGAADPQVDHRADIYSFGVLAYEVLTGSPPFTGRSAATLIAAHTIERPEPVAARRPNLPPALADLVMRCLEKRPADRPQTAAELLQVLESPEFMSGTGSVAPAPREVSEAAPPAPVADEPVAQRGEPLTARLGARRRTAALYGIAALALAALVVASLWLRPRVADRPTPAMGDPSIAVLPLANLSGDSRDAALVDGLTEELIGVLAKIDRLRVVARTSAFVFRNSNMDVRRIADSLRVSNILEGSVQKVGQNIRVQVRLVDARDGSTRWSESYDRELKDIFLVQSDIATAVARELDLRLGTGTVSALRRKPTQNIAAYELYLRGNDRALLRTDSTARLALQYFRQAAALDSNYAGAYAGMARMYLRLRLSDFAGASARGNYALAKAAASKAVALDDSLAEAHAAVGMVGMIGFDFATAEKELQRAIALDPVHSRIREWLSFLYYWQERPADALAEANRAVENDPLSPTAHAEVGRALCANGQVEQGLGRLKSVEAVQPPLARVAVYKALCHGKNREWAAAVAALPESSANLVNAVRGHALAHAGQREEALVILAELTDRWKRTNDGAFLIAVVHAGLGDRDRAFEWLNRSLDDASPVHQLVPPLFDDLRVDPRFQQFRRRVGLQNR